MSQFKPESKIDVLYQKFSNKVFVPSAYWTTVREFKLDPLYQKSPSEYVADLRLQKHQHEFVLDTSLVPPPGIEPGSSDFQSGA